MYSCIYHLLWNTTTVFLYISPTLEYDYCISVYITYFGIRLLYFCIYHLLWDTTTVFLYISPTFGYDYCISVYITYFGIRLMYSCIYHLLQDTTNVFLIATKRGKLEELIIFNTLLYKHTLKLHKKVRYYLLFVHIETHKI